MWDPGTTFDLHLHSTRSDGRHPPDEVLARCARAGLDVVALSDHDLPTAFETGWREVEGRPLLALAAAELSGLHERVELHLLAYFRGPVPEGFRAFCREQCVARARRYEEARARLPGGVAPSDAEAGCGERALTRMHLARELVRLGRARDVRESFARWLGDGHGLVPPVPVPFVDVIRVARAHGALTSWAHPAPVQVDRWLPTFVAAGLQGLEALRPALPSDDRRRLRKAAQRHGLFVTGGSDWHGWGDDGDLGLFRVAARDLGPFLEAFGPPPARA